MNRPSYLLALAEAMQLHDERVSNLAERVSKARSELDRADSDLSFAMRARDDFKRGMQARDSKP